VLGFAVKISLIVAVTSVVGAMLLIVAPQVGEGSGC
jgi:hypothetical protein